MNTKYGLTAVTTVSLLTTSIFCSEAIPAKDPAEQIKAWISGTNISSSPSDYTECNTLRIESPTKDTISGLRLYEDSSTQKMLWVTVGAKDPKHLFFLLPDITRTTLTKAPTLSSPSSTSSEIFTSKERFTARLENPTTIIVWATGESAKTLMNKPEPSDKKGKQ